MPLVYRILLAGRVQGVGCRAQVYKKLVALGPLNGFVRNLANGQVEIVLEDNDLDKIVIRQTLQELDFPVRVDQIVEQVIEFGEPLGPFFIRRD